MAKKSTIIVRTDEDTKQGLLKLAAKSRRELSDYLRLVFEDLIKEGKTL